MFSAIVCVDSKFGIAKDGKIPWYISEDLKHFRKKTLYKNVIMGRKTFESIPSKLDNRNIISISRKTHDLEDIISDFVNNDNDQEVIIAGGESIYEELFSLYDKIYITIIEKDYKCDQFFPKIPFYFKITEHSDRLWNQHEKVYYRFITYEKQYRDAGLQICYPTEITNNFTEQQYINICNKILDDGNFKDDRTGTGTLSDFGNKMTLDISDNIPILTTKRVAWKTCINELLWFLRGSTNVKELQDVGCKIWNGNTTKEFKEKSGLSHLAPEDCGPIYGHQWKHFGAQYKDCYTDYTGQGIDQIQYIIDEINNNPNSRRLVMSGWNPCDLNKGVLPPCHTLAQFYVNNGKLSCQMYQRSADFFLGVPFNILSYTVLTYIIALKCNLKPDKLIMVFGDTHIYNDHIEQVKQQIRRKMLSKPILKLNKDIKDKDWNDITINDFELIGYFPHPSIFGKMSA